MEFRTKILQGKFEQVPDLRRYNEKDCIVTVNEYKVNRNLEQNKLYWVRLKELASESGYRKSELHEYFKYIFLTLPLLQQINPLTPFLSIDRHIVCSATNDVMKELNVLISTTKLNTKEFSDYMKKVENWALENYELDLTFIKE